MVGQTHAKTGHAPVYRYRFEQTLPLAAGRAGEPRHRRRTPAKSNSSSMCLDSRQLPWRPEDRQVSDRIAAYWTNFAKTGSRMRPICRDGRSIAPPMATR